MKSGRQDPQNREKTQKSSSTVALRERFPACNALGGWYNERALRAPAPSPEHNARPQWMMILKMSSGIGPVSGRAVAGDSPGGWPLQIVRTDLSLLFGAPIRVTVVLGKREAGEDRGGLIELGRIPGEAPGERLRKEGSHGLDIRDAKFVSRLSEFSGIRVSEQGSDGAVDRRSKRCSGARGR